MARAVRAEWVSAALRLLPQALFTGLHTNTFEAEKKSHPSFEAAFVILLSSGWLD